MGRKIVIMMVIVALVRGGHGLEDAGKVVCIGWWL